MYTTIHGRIVGYDERGSDIPLVLIHGFPFNRMIWEAQWEGLLNVAHVLALDLRGFGESEMIAGPVSVEAYADEVHAFLREMGVEDRAVICGLSMGGYIAMAYLRKYSQHVAGMIYANTKATPDSAEGKAGRDKNIALAQEKGAAAIAEVMLPKLFAPKSYETKKELVEQVNRIMHSATVPGIVGALGAMRDRPDSLETLQQADVPTLIIAGTDDALMPMAEQEKMNQAARGSKLVVIPDAGHLSPMEQPEAFNQAVAEFLQTLAR
jgi:3-oxoadipate enol-lactonase